MKTSHNRCRVALRHVSLFALLAVVGAGCRSYESQPVGSAQATTTPAPSISEPAPPPPPPSTQPTPTLPAAGLGPGDQSEEVRFLEQRLDALHFDVGTVDDSFDEDTAHGVVAFQKLTGLTPDGRANQALVERLVSAQPPAPLVANGEPTRVEIDLPHQVLLLYEGGAIAKILPVSTGTGERYCARGRCGIAKTPGGNYQVDYNVKGWEQSPLGRLYNPVYFDPKNGLAIHGFPDVPPEPASHGCVRIPMSAAEWFPEKAPKGTPVYVVDGETPVGPGAPRPSG